MIDVFTEREGLLTSAGHDLCLRVTRFNVAVDTAAGGRTTASVDAGGLVVLHAIVDGAPRPQALSESDRARIDAATSATVLEAGRHRWITFESTMVDRRDAAVLVEGKLTLHGVTRVIRFELVRSEGRFRGELVLHQPDYAIRPYTTALGALRVKPDVRVRLDFPDLTRP